MKITALCLVLSGIAALLIATAAKPTGDLDRGIYNQSTSLANLEEFGSDSTNLLPEESDNLIRRTRKTFKFGKSGKRGMFGVLKKLGKEIGKRVFKKIVDAGLDRVLNKAAKNEDEATTMSTTGSENAVLNKLPKTAL